MNLIAETQLRQLHQLWPDYRWSLQRTQTGYTMVRRSGDSVRVFHGATADEAIVRAHIRTWIEPSTPTRRLSARSLRVVAGGLDDAA